TWRRLRRKKHKSTACKGEAAMSWRAVMSSNPRIALACVSTACVVGIWLLWVATGQAEDAAVTVEVTSTPSLDRLHAQSDLARLTLTVWLHGKPLSQGRMQVQLMAPLHTPVLATGAPQVEGTPLLALNSELTDGMVTWQYRFPIRGTYTLDLEIAPVAGGPEFPPSRLRKTVHISENPAVVRHTWLFIIGLFVLGGITGVMVARAAAARRKRLRQAIVGPLVLCCGTLGPISTVAAHVGHPEHAAYGTSERQVIR